MEKEPWEALDIDDSDLSTFLYPCKRHCNPSSDSPTLIPGPAGAVQSAMIHRRSTAEEPLPTQEFVRRVFQNGHDTDPDFHSNPWLTALQFVTSATPLGSIKKHLYAGRVDYVVAVVKSCNPNGFGDAMVTIKDPTGTVGASIHRKVFTESEFGKDIVVGSVLLLQKVAVFSPTSSTCYLNITLHNVVKVFSKDCGPPSEQVSPASSEKRAAPQLGFLLQTETHEKSRMIGSTFSLPQDSTEGTMTNLRLASSSTQEADVGKQWDEILLLTSSHSDNGNDRNKRIVLNKEKIPLSEDCSRPVEVTCGGELESEVEDQSNLPQLYEGDNLAGVAPGGSSTSSVHTSDSQQPVIKNHLERQKEIVNPISSMIPHWTEEQLDELLAFD